MIEQIPTDACPRIDAFLLHRWGALDRWWITKLAVVLADRDFSGCSAATHIKNPQCDPRASHPPSGQLPAEGLLRGMRTPAVSRFFALGCFLYRIGIAVPLRHGTFLACACPVRTYDPSAAKDIEV